MLILAIASLAPAIVTAQETPLRVPLDSGTLVRMTPIAGPPFEGRLLSPYRLSDSTLHTCRYPGPPCTDPIDTVAMRRVQLAALSRIQVQRGTHAGSGAVIGGLIGAALGGLSGAWLHSLCESQECASSADMAPIRMGAFGAAIGALFGWASPRWGQP